MLYDYAILTDSTCDLSFSQVAEYGVNVLPMNATVGDFSFFHYTVPES
jgi:fatty acid-binding protein DegV